MPELPEVETVVRGLRNPLIGRTVQGMTYTWAKTVHSPDPDTFAARIAGQTVRGVNRRAKYILVELDDDILLIHLKLTGRLYLVRNDEDNEADRWVRFTLQMDDDYQLRFSDVRKFGRVYLTHDIETVTGDLGPEPLADEFTAEVFKARLQGRKKSIKAMLLDQTFVAGVGNIYADEALHRAKIHPERGVNTLNDDELTRLHAEVRGALIDGIEHEGASISWYRKPDGTQGESQKHFYVYGQDGEPCRTCGTTIVKTRVAQRGTHFCPTCQPETP